MVYEITLALFGVVGLAACVRFVWGLLVYPLRNVIILLPAKGDGRDLEPRLKAVQALRDEGKLEDETLYLADFGLDEAGLALAEQLCRCYPNAGFCVMTEEDAID